MPKVSMSITVLKALKDRALAGHRKFPAAPEPQGQAGQGWERCQGPSVIGRVRDNVSMHVETALVRDKLVALGAQQHSQHKGSRDDPHLDKQWPCTTHRSLLPLCSQGCLCRETPKPSPALSTLTINEDVNPLELLQRLVHCCHDGLGLPDIHGQGQALLPCGCHQLF